MESYNYGIANISEKENAREKYAEQALSDSEDMPLAIRAFFVGCLDYVPGHGISGPMGADWVALRSDRTKQRLDIWTQINQLLAVDHPYPNRPPLPDKKYWASAMIDGFIDPRYITDANQRAIYSNALDQYWQDIDLCNQQHQAKQLQGFFVYMAKSYLEAAYSAPPDGLSELKQDLNTYGISATDQQDILGQITPQPTSTNQAGQ